jgi:RHS repeat-associated protein
VDVALPDGYMMQSTWYRVQTTLSGANIKVSWNGQQLINWTDPSSPFLSGKVGLRQDNSMHAHWDNFVAWSTGAPTILAYDDYYPFGQNMDYRSYNNGFADARYKYTEKERDSETGYDYFGARYYDARVGRWMSVDPLAEISPDLAPFVYAHNNSMVFIDPSGMLDTSSTGENPAPMPEVITTAQRIPEPITIDIFMGPMRVGKSLVDFLDKSLSLNLPSGVKDFFSTILAPFPTGVGARTVFGQAAVAKEAVRTAEFVRLFERLKSIARIGRGKNVLEMKGGLEEARALFNELSQGGKAVAKPGYSGDTFVQFRNGDSVGFRTITNRSPESVATIDINTGGTYFELKFNP